MFKNFSCRFYFLRFAVITSILQTIALIIFYGVPEWDTEDTFSFERIDYENNFNLTCALPEYNFSHPEIMKFLNIEERKYHGEREKPFTQLINGSWSVIEKNAECKARCHYFSNATHNEYGDWMTEQGPVDCEILETLCDQPETQNYFHTQIIKDLTTTENAENKPSVIVIMIDSVSFGGAKRNFHKTLPFFRDEFKAVEFPYINKVGENSRPNGIAFLMGKLLTRVDREIFGKTSIPVDWSDEYFCENFKDNETHLFKDFSSYGYKTLYADDWIEDVTIYPGCKGFEHPPVNHYMKPYQIAIENKYLEDKDRFCTDCPLEFEAMIDYLEKFLHTYSDQPKFSISWESGISHDYIDRQWKYDDILHDFLKKNKKILDNSFLILMGDHGHRMGSSRMLKRKAFAFETNNPFFAISIPKKLRNGELLKNLVENSKSLQTHFDSRATLLDILKFQPTSNFTSTEFMEIAGERGHSFLRHSSNEQRTCANLPIPIQFCICQYNLVRVPNDTLKEFIGRRVTENLNILLNYEGFSEKCEYFTFRKTTELMKYEDNFNKPYRYYIATVSMGYPSYAIFKTYVRHNVVENSVTSGHGIRMENYGTQSACISRNDFKPICYCKFSQSFSFNIMIIFLSIFFGLFE